MAPLALLRRVRARVVILWGGVVGVVGSAAAVGGAPSLLSDLAFFRGRPGRRVVGHWVVAAGGVGLRL